MTDNSDLDRQIAQLKRCEFLKESEVKALCDRAREILVDEGNVQRVNAPVTASALFSLMLASDMSPDLRRHSWAVLRSFGAISSRRRLPRYKLSVFG